MNQLGMYLIKAGLAQVCMYLVFLVFLKKLTFFRANRVYLLLALVLPFVLAIPHSTQIPLLQAYQVPFQLPAWDEQPGNPVIITGLPVSGIIPIPFIISLIYCFGLLLILLRMLVSVAKILLLAKRSVSIPSDGYRFVLTENGSAPFSFFNLIFISGNLKDNKAIADHEKVHARQGHSYDLLLAELACALLWFNPFVFFHKHAIRLNHEYLADQRILQSDFDIEKYLKTLTESLYHSQIPGFASHFNQGLTKKRICMMFNTQSRKRAFVHYALIVPVILFILTAYSKPHLTQIKNVHVLPVLQVQDSIPSILPFRKADSKSVFLTSGFGKRKNPYTHKPDIHNAIDFRAPEGLDIIAPASGIVEQANEDSIPGYGKMVIISHGAGYKTLYAHLSEISVHTGEQVNIGQVIGKVGSTGISIGPHLHYSVIRSGVFVDPATYIPAGDMPAPAK
jgi:murein DD-endopeptidase MepM/ murein hydrolase activator NlpD